MSPKIPAQITEYLSSMLATLEQKVVKTLVSTFFICILTSITLKTIKVQCTAQSHLWSVVFLISLLLVAFG